MSLSRFIFLVPKANYKNNFSASFTYGTKVMPLLSSFSPRIDFIFEKKTLAEELGIPAPPKRPLSVFFKYIGEEKQNLSYITNHKDRLKVAGQNWNSLSDSEKSKYFQSYHLELETYKKNIKEYKSSLSQDQIMDMKLLKEKKIAENAAALKKKKRRKESEELGKPRHPGNALTVFLRETENSKHAGQSAAKVIQNQWNNLPESSREIYLLKAKKLMEKYQSDLYSWEMKMLKMDRKDLVRLSTISNIKKEKKR